MIEFYLGNNEAVSELMVGLPVFVFERFLVRILAIKRSN